MKKSEIKQFKQKLLDLKEELRVFEASVEANAEPVELDQSKVGRLSRMDAMQAQQMALETKRRRQDQLRRIQTALRRIESDDYGYCIQCDETMDSRRLKVDPSSAKCIKCAD